MLNKRGGDNITAAMSITAKQLSKSGAKSKELDTAIRDQLVGIDDHLQRVDRTWGRNIVAHELPTAFSFSGLEKKDAQRIVYAAIVKSLTDRNFVVRLLLDTDRTVAYIEWAADLGAEEVDAMNSVIRKARISKEELGEYLGGASLK